MWSWSNLVIFIFWTSTVSTIISIRSQDASKYDSPEEVKRLRARIAIQNSCQPSDALRESMAIVISQVDMYLRIGFEATRWRNWDILDLETFTRYFGATHVERNRRIVHYRFRKLVHETSGTPGRVAVDCDDGYAQCETPQDKLSVPSVDFLDARRKPYIYPIHLISVLNLVLTSRTPMLRSC